MKTMKTSHGRPALHARHALAAAAFSAVLSIVSAGAAQAAVTTDPVGDVFTTYTGPRTSANSVGALDIVNVGATFDGANVRLTFDVDGLVKPSDSEGFYVWGVDRGKGTDRFAASPEGHGTLFDFTVTVRADGTASTNDLILGGGQKALATDLVSIVAGKVSVLVPLDRMPAQGFDPADFAFTLWSRGAQNAGSGTPQLFADFAPRITADAVPEPAAWALLIAGFGGVGATVRRRRASLQAA